MSGSSTSGVSPSNGNPFATQGLQQQLTYQQQQALQNSKLQAALQQNGLAQLGSLTGNDMSPQSLQTLQTNLQNLQELANLQNLQAWQNLRNLQSLQVILAYFMFHFLEYKIGSFTGDCWERKRIIIIVEWVLWDWCGSQCSERC